MWWLSGTTIIIHTTLCCFLSKWYTIILLSWSKGLKKGNLDIFIYFWLMCHTNVDKPARLIIRLLTGYASDSVLVKLNKTTKNIAKTAMLSVDTSVTQKWPPPHSFWDRLPNSATFWQCSFEFDTNIEEKNCREKTCAIDCSDSAFVPLYAPRFLCCANNLHSVSHVTLTSMQMICTVVWFTCITVSCKKCICTMRLPVSYTAIIANYVLHLCCANNLCVTCLCSTNRYVCVICICSNSLHSFAKLCILHTICTVVCQIFPSLQKTCLQTQLSQTWVVICILYLSCANNIFVLCK